MLIHIHSFQLQLTTPSSSFLGVGAGLRHTNQLRRVYRVHRGKREERGAARREDPEPHGREQGQVDEDGRHADHRNKIRDALERGQIFFGSFIGEVALCQKIRQELVLQSEPLREPVGYFVLCCWYVRDLDDLGVDVDLGRVDAVHVVHESWEPMLVCDRDVVNCIDQKAVSQWDCKKEY